MENSLKGKRVLVTGAGRGIGRALVEELVKREARVIALSRTQTTLDVLKNELPEIQTVTVDVKNWKDTEDAVKRLGPVDLLVNNAGVLSAQEVGSITEEEVDNCLAINVKAVLNISQVVAQGMKERGQGGSIVNISSQAALIGVVGMAAYCASKGAVDQITKAMALELGPHQIRVNSINPGLVLTEMGQTALKPFGESDAVLEQLKANIPLGRICEVEDVVKATMFLLSDDSKMITGIQLPIDGGFIAK